MGDPAGVGPELLCRTCADPALRRRATLIAVADPALLARVAGPLGLPLPEHIEQPCALPNLRDLVPGQVQAAAGVAALACLEHAIAACQHGRADALITAPICKAAIHLAGCPFPGHTELLAERLGGRPIMMLYDRRIAVALITVHQRLASVPTSLAGEQVLHAARCLDRALRRLRRRSPRLALLGLNPHAGEEGLFGDEEARILAPAAELLRAEGLDITGPLPPDTAFTPAARQRFDGHICCYHDQGLIPFKALAFSQGVNVTLGLPIVRCSPDHGCAFDLAWQGRAAADSMHAAVRLALRLASTPDHQST